MYADIDQRRLEAESSTLDSSRSNDSNRDVASLRIALEKYERILGPNADAAEDVQQLALKLEIVEKEKAALQLQLSEAEAATNSIYSEVEGLSKLWTDADRQGRDKVFELKDQELRMSRANQEKAKADNKYFQAMRAKEGVDGECKTAQRSVEKQLKMLEKAQEVERALQAQIVSSLGRGSGNRQLTPSQSAQDKGLTALKNQALELQSQFVKASSEKNQLEIRLQQSSASLSDAQLVMRQRVADYTEEKSAREKLEEKLQESDKEIKQLKEQQVAYEEAGGGAADMILLKERDQLKVSSYPSRGDLILSSSVNSSGIDEVFGMRDQL